MSPTSKGLAPTQYSSTTSGKNVSSISAGVAALLASFPAVSNLNISTEGTVDWFAQFHGAGSSQATFETYVQWTWKLAGPARGRIINTAIDPNEGIGNGVGVNTQTTSPLALTCTAGDCARVFSANPERNCSFVAPQNTAAALGCGHGIVLPGDGSTRTYKLYVYLNKRCVAAVTAHAMDLTTADSTLVLNENTTQGTIYTCTFNCKIPVGQSVFFSATVTATNQGDTFCGAGFQAVTIF